MEMEVERKTKGFKLIQISSTIFQISMETSPKKTIQAMCYAFSNVIEV